MTNERDERLLVWHAGTASACMFGVAVLAQFIEPDGWAIWPISALLAVAVVLLTRIGLIVRRIFGPP